MNRRCIILKFRLIFILLFLFTTSFFAYNLFSPIYTSNEIIITFGFHPFDICSKNPELWTLIKIIFIATFIFSNFVISNFIFTRIISKHFSSPAKKHKNWENKASLKNPSSSDLFLTIGKNQNNELILIPEYGLYQNFLITGTIGSGKTSSAMYPFTKQLIRYNAEHQDKKIGMLILDVKGNYCSQVKSFAEEYGILSDLIVIGLGNDVYYNPLDKPNLKPIVLANRLKTILTLFSENNSESYWLDKAEQILSECIKICRLYNDNYVTFSELHKLITIPNYFSEKIKILRDLFISSSFSQKDIYELNCSLDFFQKEFNNLDPRTKGILISEITRITNTFISDYDVYSTFCSDKSKLSFNGFSDVIQNGKIVVLNLNIAEYSLLSKIIATYLKLDFQSEILSFLSKGLSKRTAFICDEYDKYCTKTDADFFSVSREAKCINIVSSQSYSSLKNALHDDSCVKVIIQNLINKLWFRTDDIFTIEEAQKQLGKEDKEKISRSISESAKETKFSYITNTLNSENSNISETFSTFTQNDFIFDSNFFTQNLKTFEALSFLSDGNKIITPQKIKMFPYFKFK